MADKERSGRTSGSQDGPPWRRRRFGDAERLRILDEADRCTRPGELGLLLRREGIYSSKRVTACQVVPIRSSSTSQDPPLPTRSRTAPMDKPEFSCVL
jgi:hypothetical protein